MIHFTPEQYAVFVGGVRYIKKAIKKKTKRKSTGNRKQKKGTRRRQKGGNSILRTTITGLFLAALFSAYLINTGTDMSLQTGIMAFSDAANLGVNAEDINNFMEGLAIMIFYAGVNWEVDGQRRPSTCEQGKWVPYIPGYGNVPSFALDPVPGWSTDCPRNAHILSTVLSSVLAGMFIAWIGPCILNELVESTIGPPPASVDQQAPPITIRDQPPTASEILADAVKKVTVDPNDPLLQKSLASRKQKPKRQLTLEERRIMTERAEERRRICATQYAIPPLRRMPTISEEVKSASSPNASQELVSSSLKEQEQPAGNTLIALPADVMAQLTKSGDLQNILDMVKRAADQVAKQDQFQQQVNVMGSTIFQLGDRGQLQLQDALPKVNCETPLPPGSCPSIPPPLPKQGAPEIEVLEEDEDEDVKNGGAKRKLSRRIKRKKKKTKKKSRKRR